MKKAAVILLAIFALFLAANRKSWLGYFQDDDLDNIGWTSQLPAAAYVEGLLKPTFDKNNFRPVGHFFYHAMERAAGLNFPPYLAALTLLNLLNIALVFVLARRANLGETGSAIAALWFSMHPAAFDAWWKPTYVFDVLCATFCLLSLLAWSYRRWALSFIAFWIAYKAKEPAILLPAVLLAWEMWLGERKWKRLVPFFAVSALFGIQAMVSGTRGTDEYTLSFWPDDMWRSAVYYASQMFAIPYLGLATLGLGFVFRDRRVWIGLGAMWLFLLPVLALPRHLYAVYLYLPLVGLSLAVGVIFEKYIPRPALAAAALFAVWIPVTYMQMKPVRGLALASAGDNRTYVATLAGYVREHPAQTQYVYDGFPYRLRYWGIEGLVRYLRRSPGQRIAGYDQPEAAKLLGTAPVLSWDFGRRRLDIIERAGGPDQPYLSMERQTPLWQLGEGWFQRAEGFRWSRPDPSARLYRPEGSRLFEVVLNLGPDFMAEAKSVKLQLLLDGQEAGDHEFRSPGIITHRFDLSPAQPGTVKVEFRIGEFHPSNGDPRVLGAPFVAFGFPAGS